MATERKIGRDVYRCEPISAADALPLFGQMTKLFDADTMAAVAKGMDRKAACENFLVLFAGAADTDALQAFFRRMVEMCQVGGDPCVIGHRPESMEDIAEVGFMAVEAQFRNFLSVALPADTKGGTGAEG